MEEKGDCKRATEASEARKDEARVRGYEYKEEGGGRRAAREGKESSLFTACKVLHSRRVCTAMTACAARRPSMMIFRRCLHYCADLPSF